jgi:hypothetical protein
MRVSTLQGGFGPQSDVSRACRIGGTLQWQTRPAAVGSTIPQGAAYLHMLAVSSTAAITCKGRQQDHDLALEDDNHLACLSDYAVSNLLVRAHRRLGSGISCNGYPEFLPETFFELPHLEQRPAHFLQSFVLSGCVDSVASGTSSALAARWTVCRRRPESAGTSSDCRGQIRQGERGQKYARGTGTSPAETCRRP